MLLTLKFSEWKLKKMLYLCLLEIRMESWQSTSSLKWSIT